MSENEHWWDEEAGLTEKIVTDIQSGNRQLFDALICRYLDRIRSTGITGPGRV